MAEPTPDFTMMLSEDKQSVQLSLRPGASFKAAELENIMRQLAWMRASMLPAVPDEDLNEQSLISAVPAFRWYVSPDQDAPTQIRLFLLHRGFGWVWLPLGQLQVKALIATMQRVLRHLPKLQ